MEIYHSDVRLNNLLNNESSDETAFSESILNLFQVGCALSTDVIRCMVLHKLSDLKVYQKSLLIMTKLRLALVQRFFRRTIFQNIS